MAKVQAPPDSWPAGMAEYKPGVCNIGPRGRMQRATFGFIAIAFSVGIWSLVRLNALDRWIVLLLFIPLFGSFVSVFEAALGTCVVFAERGVYDLR